MLVIWNLFVSCILGFAVARTIFHVDMDAFYASVEQRNAPRYREQPVIVGADPKEGKGRGVVAACSYEARRYGIHSAMPIGKAYRLCPDGVYLRPNISEYTRVSRSLREVFRSFTDLVEPLSIDEAFLDMTGQVGPGSNGTEMARSLKRAIREKESLSASIGIAPNKFLAKIASDLEKPDGLVVVNESGIESFLDPLEIRRLWGVGPKTEARLRKRGIDTIQQLRESEKESLVQHFGKLGQHLWALSRGIDNRPVVTQRKPKSVGHERTFAEDVMDSDTLETTLERLSQSVAERLHRSELSGKTVTLKLRYSDFTTITRQSTFRDVLDQGPEIFSVARRLLQKFRDPDRRVRLIGVSVTSLESLPSGSIGRQLNLFH